jgi:hypothetical protein
MKPTGSTATTSAAVNEIVLVKILSVSRPGSTAMVAKGHVASKLPI